MRDFPFWRSFAAHTLFRPFNSIHRPAAAAIADALGVIDPADDVITHARKVFNATSADHDYGVFLKVMPLAGDVGGHFHAVTKPHAGNLPESRVRLLGSHGGHLDAHSPLEWRAHRQILPLAANGVQHRLERRRSGLFDVGSPAFADQLSDCRHKKKSVEPACRQAPPPAGGGGAGADKSTRGFCFKSPPPS